MADFGIFRGFSENLFGDKSFAGQTPNSVGKTKDDFFNYLLDDHSNNVVGAWSNRLISSSYSGPLINIRRDSDYTEQDFYGTQYGLDINEIETFLNGSNGYVTIWYDQSGNGINLMQLVYSNQPRIAQSGVVNVNSEGNVYFTCFSNNSYMYNYTGVDIVGNAGHSVFCVMRQTTQQNTSVSDLAYFAYGAPGTGTCVRMVMEQPSQSGYGAGYRINAGNQLSDSSYVDNSLFYSYNLNYKSGINGTSPSDAPFYINGEVPNFISNAYSTSINMVKNTVYLNAGIGTSSNPGIYPANTDWGEVIMYNTDLDSTNENFEIINKQRNYWQFGAAYYI